MADKFGAGMVAALGDVCETHRLRSGQDLAALAAQQLNALAQKVTARLGLTLAAGADVRDHVAAQCTTPEGGRRAVRLLRPHLPGSERILPPDGQAADRHRRP